MCIFDRVFNSLIKYKDDKFIIMDHKQHLKTVPYSTPLFANAFIAYPFSQPNSISYLMLSGQ